ncbi:HAD-IA family hydrolase [Candidatus Parcubacteria bacterium]|jgi:HAD superfamily hydrolase (TIGR01509 family)|nr:HAD-IA family hydrolase [Candidatus Parcubacteria bacterium]MBT7228596.1 HAD-IA family hydrolase [Candidatus Parcubacteria bacterium]
MVKAVILDLNGVILSEGEYFTKRLENKYNIPSEKFYKIFDEVMHIGRKPNCQDFFKLWEPKLVELGIKVSREEFFDLWFSGENLVTEFLDYIQELREQGVNVFILSNNFKERTEFYRANYPQIFDSVDGAYFSCETGFVKPDVQAYQKLLEQQNLEARDVLYFDDVEENVAAAGSTGIVSYIYKNLEETKKVVDSLK